ncbi:hypothetical protein BU16DRAFT_343709 [Lophium mytilinum]|uniref:Uncharacterized protein n=1 Tax=Lophium mytilinum TaxID=390894 RepID=A0A6A6QXW1_9PEZI|nr:hypothetical protein BU16DRAFT_343709 [Lophium mytilinum]
MQDITLPIDIHSNVPGTHNYPSIRKHRKSTPPDGDYSTILETNITLLLWPDWGAPSPIASARRPSRCIKVLPIYWPDRMLSRPTASTRRPLRHIKALLYTRQTEKGPAQPRPLEDPGDTLRPFYILARQKRVPPNRVHSRILETHKGPSVYWPDRI